MTMDWYNGYSPAERQRAQRAINAARTSEVIQKAGACMLCGDPSADLELHCEDYSRPYRFDPPAAYWLCYFCHRHRLHKRFANPIRWAAFKKHVARGGYASDLHEDDISQQVRRLEGALESGRDLELPTLRVAPVRNPWWEALSLDATTKHDPRARPRP